MVFQDTISAANRARGVELGQAIDSAVGHPLFSTSDGTGNQVLLDFGVAAEIDHVIVQEDLRYGERVRAFAIDGWDGTQWQSIVTGGAAPGNNGQVSAARRHGTPRKPLTQKFRVRNVFQRLCACSRTP